MYSNLLNRMSGSKKMTLRVQSPEGTSRIEVLDTDVTSRLYERVYEILRLNTYGFSLYRDRQRKEEIISSKSHQLREYGLQHGDMLYLNPVNGAVLFDQPSTSAEDNNKPSGEPVGAGPSASSAPVTVLKPEEDEVDLELYKLSGAIQRERDDKLCRHNSKGCCVHCSPLEPWDEGYLREHNIKHMSFHAYLRKITSGKFISLDELSCKIKPGCKEHPPWPRGICSACQPGAVTLNRQPYRHVDNVLFQRPALVERLLAYWRATGHQRLAFLYGRYERHPDVPLGIRARVTAVWEPPQESGRDSIVVGEEPHAALLADLAARLGLRRLGWIFTDLLPEDLAAGTVRHLRGVDTHFLSAQECITAGHFQNLHPNACRHASSGYFGSKFVTVCVTGDSEKQVHLEGYQVSGQCQALVRDGILLPTRDAPELGYIRDCSAQHYVPDVYYKERDAYGNEVGVSARRVPVAYLLVDVPVGVARQPAAPPAAPAPPAALHSLRDLHRHIEAAPSFLEAMSELHVLLFLCTNEALPLSLSCVAPLVEAVRAQDGAAAERWRAGPQAGTLLQLARAAAEGEGEGEATLAPWTCALCTYHNAPELRACEMCAMPRNDGM
ncbi:PREDICTED: nuclear protein localization protein 4 homolog [Papilio xuthus]|uniref:Nuclear protein localization protein 4 homolog n=1 Tax=Papilio xuthus TaxID=66420 RepID=A0AAJ7ED19_PAPXU|nr:PREDICTED: nuclear protein localization protein 4 homolog [Papilio xuthus]